METTQPSGTSGRSGRPGQGAVVARTLDELQGPTHGVVELPHHLLWQSNRTVDLDDDWDREWAIVLVLREARNVEDLRRWVDGGVLRRLWPTLNLPRALRAAWEKRHPVLGQRHAAA